MSYQCKDRCFAAHVAIVVAVVLLAASLVGQAHGSGYGRVVNQQRVVVANNAVVPYPVIGYQVGQHLQQAAVDEYGFRNSPSQQRLLYLEGAHAATLKFLESGFMPGQPQVQSAAETESSLSSVTEGVPVEQPVAPTVEPAVETPPCPNCNKPPAQPAVETPLYAPPAATTDLAAVESDFETVLPSWAAACAKCHSGDSPKGDTHVGEELIAALDEADVATLEHYRDIVVTGKMPKGTALDDATQGALLLELQRAKQ